jgi:hypothetical protein
MLDQCRRQRRLFCLRLCVLAELASQAQSPATTTISDTVYRADGTPAAGTLLISWPTFSTASGQAVAAGTNSVTLSAGGALSVGLAPNAGAAPANTYYVVVYQLSDGTVKTEFWSVGTISPTTIAAVRTRPVLAARQRLRQQSSMWTQLLRPRQMTRQWSISAAPKPLLARSSFRWRRACQLRCRAEMLRIKPMSMRRLRLRVVEPTSVNPGTA